MAKERTDEVVIRVSLKSPKDCRGRFSFRVLGECWGSDKMIEAKGLRWMDVGQHLNAAIKVMTQWGLNIK
jgi:hypothetical protein